MARSGRVGALGAPLIRNGFAQWRASCACRTSLRRAMSFNANNKFLKVSAEVQGAVAAGRPVVALETTIYTHGFPFPDNVRLANDIEQLVRREGAVPAHIGFLDGAAVVGMQEHEMLDLLNRANSGHETIKLSRKDLGYIAGQAQLGKQINGGTTIAGTMILAHLAGIQVFATGGLGGVHKGGELSMDVSADLTELGRTPVALVSSGCKSFLDIPRTLEYLETQGVGVGTFADGREGSVDFPAFWTRNSGTPSPRTIRNEDEAAAIIYAQSQLGLQSGLLFANPIAEEFSLAKNTMDEAMAQAVKDAEIAGVTGHANTPFVLARIRELTEGKTIRANQELAFSNVIRGAKVAKKLAALHSATKNYKNDASFSLYTTAAINSSDTQLFVPAEVSRSDPDPSLVQCQSTRPSASRRIGELWILGPSMTNPSKIVRRVKLPIPSHLLVVGSIAQDVTCDLRSIDGASHRPASWTLEVSNPARARTEPGGVGLNIARAAAYAGAFTTLHSHVGHDPGGRWLDNLTFNECGKLTIRNMRLANKSTAQYIALNNPDGELFTAAAEMSVFDEVPPYGIQLSGQGPKWLAIDANWSVRSIEHWCSCGISSFVAFEPVSVAKSRRLILACHRVAFKTGSMGRVDLITPNIMELRAMAEHDQELTGLLQQESSDYSRRFEIEEIPQFHVTRGNLLKRLSQRNFDDIWTVLHRRHLFPSWRTADKATGESGKSDEVKRSTIRDAISLLAYSQTVMVTLGAQGVFMVKLATDEDPLLKTQEADQYMVRLTEDEWLEGLVGSHKGSCYIYLRHFPPPQSVDPSSIVSVNGAGDTFTGVLLAGLSQETSVREDLMVPIAQLAAAFTLEAPGSVSTRVKRLESAIRLAAKSSNKSYIPQPSILNEAEPSETGEEEIIYEDAEENPVGYKYSDGDNHADNYEDVEEETLNHHGPDAFEDLGVHEGAAESTMGYKDHDVDDLGIDEDADESTGGHKDSNVDDDLGNYLRYGR